MQHSKFRGHDIEYQNNQWVYSDTKESIVQERLCGYCGKICTLEGYDGCLGSLKGIMNACCGHGEIEEAYVQFLDGFAIRGEDAKVILDILNKYKNNI